MRGPLHLLIRPMAVWDLLVKSFMNSLCLGNLEYLIHNQKKHIKIVRMYSQTCTQQTCTQRTPTIHKKSALSFDVRYVEVFSYESIVIHGVLKAYCKDSEILLEQSAIYKTLSFSLSRKYQYIIPLESFHSTFLKSNVCASSF